MMMKKKEEDCLASKTGVLGERTAGFSRALGKTFMELLKLKIEIELPCAILVEWFFLSTWNSCLSAATLPWFAPLSYPRLACL